MGCLIHPFVMRKQNFTEGGRRHKGIDLSTHIVVEGDRVSVIYFSGDFKQFNVKIRQLFKEISDSFRLFQKITEGVLKAGQISQSLKTAVDNNEGSGAVRFHQIGIVFLIIFFPVNGFQIRENQLLFPVHNV